MIPRDASVIDAQLDALPEAAIFKAFCRLPVVDRVRFARWIAKAGDEETHWRRSELLALALRKGPPGQA